MASTLQHYDPISTPKRQASAAFAITGKVPKKFKSDDASESETNRAAKINSDVSQPLKLERERDPETQDETNRAAKINSDVSQPLERDAEIPDQLTQGSNSNVKDPLLLFIHREQQLTHDRLKMFSQALKKKE